jgi:anti-anti-sigma factor
VSVRDHNPTVPQRVDAAPGLSTGREFAPIAELATAFGVGALPGGKSVWADIAPPLPESAIGRSRREVWNSGADDSFWFGGQVMFERSLAGNTGWVISTVTNTAPPVLAGNWVTRQNPDGLVVGPNGGALTVEFAQSRSRTVLRLSGRLEECALAALDVQIDQVFCSSFRTLTLELTGLVSIDKAGIDRLVNLNEYVGARGAQLQVLGARPSVARALGRTSLVQLW